MERDGHLKTLAERMKEKAEQERQEAEKIFTEQLQTLSSSLTASSQNALATMSDVMAKEITNAAATLNQHYRLLSATFAKKWIASTVLGIFLCLGMLLGGWSWVELLVWKTEKQQAELTRLETACRKQREILETLETWGVTVQDRTEGRFIVGPPSSAGGWTIDRKAAIKLE